MNSVPARVSLCKRRLADATRILLTPPIPKSVIGALIILVGAINYLAISVYESVVDTRIGQIKLGDLPGHLLFWLCVILLWRLPLVLVWINEEAKRKQRVAVYCARAAARARARAARRNTDRGEAESGDTDPDVLVTVSDPEIDPDSSTEDSDGSV